MRDDEARERSLVYALLRRIGVSVLVMGLLWTVLIAVVMDQMTSVP